MIQNRIIILPNVGYIKMKTTDSVIIFGSPDERKFRNVAFKLCHSPVRAIFLIYDFEKIIDFFPRSIIYTESLFIGEKLYRCYCNNIAIASFESQDKTIIKTIERVSKEITIISDIDLDESIFINLFVDTNIFFMSLSSFIKLMNNNIY